ncbi:asparagine synthase (glutamine-hydrolyzing) [Roseomonas sp. SSH11]|uniref:asparagine synthase (glutamine-hydrolyzing) n=1 Tax=Pararoseomonas baculiformis TaxID=2820812 RepID=A0ABS4AFX9_9PROT|nr:asparagine synthase (glutamine-hydrolyzing) [Pararoseomonas baculiformis]MBP0445149.1 asparagine synthase (glutamine-hydrolyzing) [Pararoseomonas baculiformis]
MCGIVGIFHPDRPVVPDGATVWSMAEAIRHRGPDGGGTHLEPHLGLGHRRLAVVDLAAGKQPMSVANRMVVTVFNGEIYNHHALRRELEGQGYSFDTHSDTEVILNGWCAWGPGVLDRLVGMFAFALWDRRSGELLLARDRLGEKPLHYAELPDGSLAFASEARALHVLPQVSRRLDPQAIEDYLALGYVPDPATIFAGIRRLPAAHYMLLCRGKKTRLVPQRYWSPPTQVGSFGPDAGDRLLACLDQAVRGQMMADVPLGAFLSGGVDSGAVVALAARARAAQSGAPLESFTIGFEGEADEREAAARVAELCHAQHRTEVVQARWLDAAREVAQHFGEPFGDHSAVPTLAVSALARRHVTVALSGDGGDELLGGYRRHRWHALAEAVRNSVPAPLRGRVLGGLARLYPKLDRAPRWLRAKNTLTEISLDSAVGYYRTVCKLHAERRHALLAAPLRAALDGYDPSDRFVALMQECDQDDPLLAAGYVDLQTYLPGDILVKTDRASMVHSLELRAPMLDHRFVEMALALPARMKLHRGQGKHVLREMVAPMLPPRHLAAPKRGFAAGISAPLRASAAEVRARLTGSAMLDSGLFDGAALARLADEHGSGRADHSQALWQLLVLEGFLLEESGHVASERPPVPEPA